MSTEAGWGGTPESVGASGALEVRILPILSDNYVYLLREPESGATGVVDPGDAAPVLAALSALGWTPDWILLTHHHADHIGGVEEVRAATGAKVAGAAADAHRLPPLDDALEPGVAWRFGALDVEVLDAPGHTVGHIVFHLAGARALFSGDALFALGCGRLFEGTAAQLHGALARMAALPSGTAVYAAHEYTVANADFALTIEPDNADLRAQAQEARNRRADGRPTLPTTIARERAANPYLRVGVPAVQAAVGLPGGAPSEVFAELRRRKDTF